jgi:hypothetical protein
MDVKFTEEGKKNMEAKDEIIDMVSFKEKFEKKPELILPKKKVHMVIFTNGLFLIGVKNVNYQDAYLENPRGFQIVNNGKEQEMQLSKLPGYPGKLQIVSSIMDYEIYDEDLINLYIKSTSGIVLGESKIIVQ